MPNITQSNPIVEALEQLLEPVIARAVAKAVTAPTPAPERLLGKGELAELLGVSAPTISKLGAEGLPSLLVGSSRRYRPTEVMAWLESRREAPPPPVAVDPLEALGVRRIGGRR